MRRAQKDATVFTSLIVPFSLCLSLSFSLVRTTGIAVTHLFVACGSVLGKTHEKLDTHETKSRSEVARAEGGEKKKANIPRPAARPDFTPDTRRDAGGDSKSSARGLSSAKSPQQAPSL